ncbi:asparagine synthase-related protein [Pleurocapsa sp. PCC 7319]|uniref:asparagine synthase-related protein n=1 Tax=Pleurocapsa sp. PCC 7319 TaxID=118161 RepID=UPI00034D6285|nr:asparagine synthase-related protein [Pleurocapsa sp. PCC 7319]
MINDIFAIIDWSKKNSLHALVDSSCKNISFSDNYLTEIILDKPEICFSGIRKKQLNKNSNYWHCGERDFILHGNICQGFKIDSSWVNIDFSQHVDRVFDGIYNLLIWDNRDQSLFISSDYLSAKSLYYWRDKEIVVISSNLKAFRLLPFIPQKLNPQVLATTLALSHPLSCDTLLEGVQALPINSATVFRRDKTEFLARTYEQSRNAKSLATETELITNLDSLIAQSTKTWLGDRQHALISLSGGLDSRILLGYLKHLEIEITAATWGEPGSDDFRLGIELAEATQTKYLTYILTEQSAIAEEDLKFPAWWTESFSVNNVPFYWRGWLDLLQTQQLPVIHGFLGGPLGGGRLLQWGVSPNHLAREVDERVIDELRTWGNNVAPNILTEFSTPLFKEFLTEGIAESLVASFSDLPQQFVYQRLMCLDFYYRQRRYLANAVSKIIGTFLPTMLPFYTKDNLDFVLQLPLELILDRKIFRKLLLKQFSTLASFQEADKGKLPIYSNPTSKYIDNLKNNRYAWFLFPKLKPRRSGAIFSMLLDKHLPIFINTLINSSTILNDYLDIEGIVAKLKSGEISGRDRDQIMRLFNISVFVNRYFKC